MEEADMTPGRPQQLPYVSPPDKKMSQEKSGSNIVVSNKRNCRKWICLA